MRQQPAPRVPRWRVRVEEHDVDRWHIDGQELVVYATDMRTARMGAVDRVHVAEQVAPWKPLKRLTWTHTSATPMGNAWAAGGRR